LKLAVNMIEILLFIIIILLIGDFFFLRKIYNFSKKRKQIATDEKYFELKYNINLLRAISAILIFTIGFFGYSSYKDLKNKLNSDLEESTVKQNDKILKIGQNIEFLKKDIDSLESLKEELSRV